ncbi:MYND Zn-finger protein [Ceratobasidium sp. AG-Ba]|nr:MYND Zn-finger protein [Ceratobasidium sp. AG-Ba]
MHHLYMQEVAFRVYMSGSNQDRKILQSMFIVGFMYGIKWANGGPGEFKQCSDSCCNTGSLVKHNRFSPVTSGFGGYYGSIDSALVADTWDEMLAGWEKEGFDTSKVPIVLLGQIAEYVHQMAMSDPRIRLDDLVKTIFTSLSLLWRIFDNRGRIPVVDHAHVRYYAARVFEILDYTQTKYISTHKEQHMLAAMLEHADFVALSGRVLLLMLEEGHQYENDHMFNDMISGIAKLGKMIKLLVADGHNHFLDSKFEWTKVLDHVKKSSVRAGSIMDHNDSQSVFLWTMFGAWGEWSGILEAEGYPHYPCTNPRCAYQQYILGHFIGPPYCSEFCQRTHWQLDTSDSHRLHCQPYGLLMGQAEADE